MTQFLDNNKNILEEEKSKIETARDMIKSRFDEIKLAYNNSTNVWERYELSVQLNEIKFIYDVILTSLL